ncbi:hypothetical protein HPT27_16140 [Permianibacter sp. IMCC34836]|uniref:MAPEG family protein n=1 Tax=Permianibacter fluminis TaxID=2738515 RepID=UPI001552B14B|nr:MAPEG family protein [Permianibacter fluminis]NQD38554.1 hypothetical protein [Permianibacter fluminis]
MSIAYVCVAIAGLMPCLWVGYAKFAGRGYDNQAPREFLAALSGARQRAHWAQLNAFEAFPLFAAAVIIAQISGVEPSRVDALAIAFVLLRLAYGISYIGNRPTLRSLLWSLALLSVIALFVLTAQHQ